MCLIQHLLETLHSLKGRHFACMIININSIVSYVYVCLCIVTITFDDVYPTVLESS